jgi:hypothetical protein
MTGAPCFVKHNLRLHSSSSLSQTLGELLEDLRLIPAQLIPSLNHIGVILVEVVRPLHLLHYRQSRSEWALCHYPIPSAAIESVALPQTRPPPRRVEGGPAPSRCGLTLGSHMGARSIKSTIMNQNCFEYQFVFLL